MNAKKFYLLLFCVNLNIICQRANIINNYKERIGFFHKDFFEPHGLYMVVDFRKVSKSPLNELIITTRLTDNDPGDETFTFHLKYTIAPDKDPNNYIIRNLEIKNPQNPNQPELKSSLKLNITKVQYDSLTHYAFRVIALVIYPQIAFVVQGVNPDMTSIHYVSTNSSTLIRNLVLHFHKGRNAGYGKMFLVDLPTSSIILYLNKTAGDMIMHGKFPWPAKYTYKNIYIIGREKRIESGHQNSEDKNFSFYNSKAMDYHADVEEAKFEITRRHPNVLETGAELDVVNENGEEPALNDINNENNVQGTLTTKGRGDQPRKAEGAKGATGCASKKNLHLLNIILLAIILIYF